MTFFDGPEAVATLREAIRLLSEAERERGAGELHTALQTGLTALQQLRHPGLEREHPVVLTALISLTLLCDELAERLGVPGVSQADLQDTLAAFRRAAAEMQRNPELAASTPPGWPRQIPELIPRLEARLAKA